MNEELEPRKTLKEIIEWCGERRKTANELAFKLLKHREMDAYGVVAAQAQTYENVIRLCQSKLQEGNS